MSNELMKNFRKDINIASTIMENTIPMYESEEENIDSNDNSRVAQKQDLKRIMKALEVLAGKVDGYSETLVYTLKDTVDAILHGRGPNAKMILKLLMSQVGEIKLEGAFGNDDEVIKEDDEEFTPLTVNKVQLIKLNKKLDHAIEQLDGDDNKEIGNIVFDIISAILMKQRSKAKDSVKYLLKMLPDITVENAKEKVALMIVEGTMISGYGGIQESDTAFGTIRKVGSYHVGEAHSDGEHIDIDSDITIGFYNENENGERFDSDENVADMNKLDKAWEAMLKKIDKATVKLKTEDGRKYSIYCSYDTSGIEYWLRDDAFSFRFTASFDDVKSDGLSDKDLKAMEKGFDKVTSDVYNIIKGSLKSLDAHLKDGGFMDIMESKKSKKKPKLTETKSKVKKIQEDAEEKRATELLKSFLKKKDADSASKNGIKDIEVDGVSFTYGNRELSVYDDKTEKTYIWDVNNTSGRGNEFSLFDVIKESSKSKIHSKLDAMMEAVEAIDLENKKEEKVAVNKFLKK